VWYVSQVQLFFIDISFTDEVFIAKDFEAVHIQNDYLQGTLHIFNSEAEIDRAVDVFGGLLR
jgi:hypothetical protein